MKTPDVRVEVDSNRMTSIAKPSLPWSGTAEEAQKIARDTV
ncbi:hypothetical protein [Streptomyces sp. NPDC003480]